MSVSFAILNVTFQKTRLESYCTVINHLREVRRNLLVPVFLAFSQYFTILFSLLFCQVRQDWQPKSLFNEIWKWITKVRLTTLCRISLLLSSVQKSENMFLCTNTRPLRKSQEASHSRTTSSALLRHTFTPSHLRAEPRALRRDRRICRDPLRQEPSGFHSRVWESVASVVSCRISASLLSLGVCVCG